MSNYKTNIKKVIELIETDVDAAFFLLGSNYKNHPTVETAHNFGTFISKYGKEISYCQNNYFKLARKILYEAQSLKDNYYTDKELGDLYFQSKKYVKACSLYKKAQNQNNTFDILLRLATVNFKLKKFKNASMYFEKSIELCKSRQELLNLKENLAFSYALSQNVIKARKLFDELIFSKEYEKTPDTLRLAYLCGDQGFILNNYKEIFENWIFDSETLQIVLFAYLKDKPLEFEKAKENIIRYVEQFYSDNSDFDVQDKCKLLCSLKEGSSVAEINYDIDIVWQCDFLN